MEGPVPHLDFDFVVPSRYQLEPSNRPPLHQNATERALTPLDLTSSTSTLSVMGPLSILASTLCSSGSRFNPLTSLQEHFERESSSQLPQPRRSRPHHDTAL